MKDTLRKMCNYFVGGFSDIDSGVLKKKNITGLNKRFGTSKETLLHYAVLAQDTELFKFLLAAKVDVNRTNCCSSTPKSMPRR